MTRLEIAAGIIAGWAANPNVSGTNEEAAAVSLALADALLAAAERGLDDGLVFGPWFEGERHAVAADGGRYTIAAAPEGFYFTSPPHNEPCPCESGTRATESEAIEAARAHDRARRAKGTT